MTPHPDLVLAERYTLVRRIAVGGMGDVWEATDHLLGRAVAVKILKDEFRTAPTFLARFRAEARHAGGLNHRGIATVYDYGESDDVAFLVMELVRGRPLSQLIDEQPDMPMATKLSVICQAAEGLQAAHDAGVIHRDVKPGNLLVRDDGVVKVTDFGIARALTSAPLTDHGQMIGTPSYVSPEQASGGRVTEASDTYSLGAVAYELFAGHPPFVRDTPIATALAHVNDPVPPLPESVPPNVAAIIRSALAKDPSRRPASAGDVARVLRREMATAGASPPVLPVSPAAATATLSMPVVPRDERRPTPYLHVLGALTALLLVGVMIWLVARRQSDDAVRSEASVAPSVTATSTPLSVPVTQPPTSPPTAPLPVATEPVTTEPVATVAPEPQPPDTPAPTTEPPRATEPPPTTRPPTTAPLVSAAPPTAPPADSGPVTEDEAIAFVVDYYERVRAGDYATTWESLSEEFRDARDLTFGRYVSYWQNTTIELSDLRFLPGPDADESRVVFEGRYTTGSGVVVETDEITLRRAADGSPIITAQRTV